MKNTIEIKIYNQNHSLVNMQTITADTKEIPQLVNMINISAKKRNQYVQTRIIR